MRGEWSVERQPHRVHHMGRPAMKARSDRYINSTAQLFVTKHEAVTLEEYKAMPTYVPNSPARGSRRAAEPLPVKADPGAWRKDAYCTGRFTTEDFFVDGMDGNDAKNHMARAVALCQRCPVQRECLEFALNEGHWDGVFGGFTPNQRRTVLKERDRIAVTRNSRSVSRGTLRGKASGPGAAQTARTLTETLMEVPMSPIVRDPSDVAESEV